MESLERPEEPGSMILTTINKKKPEKGTRIVRNNMVCRDGGRDGNGSLWSSRHIHSTILGEKRWWFVRLFVNLGSLGGSVVNAGGPWYAGGLTCVRNEGIALVVSESSSLGHCGGRAKTKSCEGVNQ
jgi:hypothetical protein